MVGQTCNTKNTPAKFVAKYITPNSDVDHLSAQHQKKTKHQIDMDKTCQCHHIKQDLKCQRNQNQSRTRVSKHQH